MSNEQLKPCPCCPDGKGKTRKVSCYGGIFLIAKCDVCGLSTSDYITEEQAIAAWNNRPEPKTAKPVYKWNRQEERNSYHCNCGQRVVHGDRYCRSCSAKFDWSET